MSEARDITVRVVRSGELEPVDRSWLSHTMAERIEAVWELTKLCAAWKQELGSESRLQRSVVAVQRPRS
jgi:hypothetical protein